MVTFNPQTMGAQVSITLFVATFEHHKQRCRHWCCCVHLTETTIYGSHMVGIGCTCKGCHVFILFITKFIIPNTAAGATARVNALADGTMFFPLCWVWYALRMCLNMTWDYVRCLGICVLT